jgi:hypothetical protein
MGGRSYRENRTPNVPVPPCRSIRVNGWMCILRTKPRLPQLSEARFRAGLIAEQEWTRGWGSLANAPSVIPALEKNLLAAGHRPGVLLGEVPTSLVQELDRPADLPRVPEIFCPAGGSPGSRSWRWNRLTGTNQRRPGRSGRPATPFNRPVAYGQ